MNSRVVWLAYRIELTSKTPLILPTDSFAIGNFECLVDGTTLTARPRIPFASESDARSTLEPLLRQWVFEVELHHGSRLGFRFSAAYLEDNDAGTGTGMRTLSVSASISAFGSISGTPTLALPPPTLNYLVNQRTDAWMTRLRDVREGRQHSPAAAYSLVTELEHAFGNGETAAAANRMRVSRKLLIRVRTVSSKWHPTKGRKTSGEGSPLTEDDLGWLARACELLVRRAIEVESQVDELPVLTAGDV